MTDTSRRSAKAKPQEDGSWLRAIGEWVVMIAAVLFLHSFIAKPFYIPSGSMMPVLRSGDRLLVSKYPYGWSFASVSFHLLPPMEGRIWPHPPARGDIVVLEHPASRADYIKRVIGLPGDRLTMKDGALTINGIAVARAVQPLLAIPYDANLADRGGLRSMTPRTDAAGKQWLDVPIVRETLPDGTSFDTIDTGPGMAGDDFDDIVVPAGHYFLMGDNRDSSADSRFALSANGLGGPVPFDLISGRAEFIAFSTDGTASWFNPISWFTAMRAGRSAISLRPERGAPLPPPTDTVPPAQ